MKDHTQSFALKNGQIYFEKNSIRIIDKMKNLNSLTLLSSIVWVLFSILSIYKYFKNHNEILLWKGVILGIPNLFLLIWVLFRSNKNLISYEDVKSINLTKRFGNSILHIKLKNNKTRVVTGIINSEELQEYIKVNFNKTIEVTT